MCNTSLAIPQWKNQLKLFTDINEENIIMLSSKHADFDKFEKLNKEKKPMIVITTYSMVSRNVQEDRDTQKKRMMEDMRTLEWGLFILDEVQVAPAKHFQKVLLRMKSHCKLGFYIFFYL